MGVNLDLFTLRQEHKLRVFKNRVLRNISRPKRDEVTGDWRRLRNEKRCDLYYSPNIQVINKKE